MFKKIGFFVRFHHVARIDDDTYNYVKKAELRFFKHKIVLPLYIWTNGFPDAGKKKAWSFNERGEWKYWPTMTRLSGCVTFGWYPFIKVRAWKA